MIIEYERFASTFMLPKVRLVSNWKFVEKEVNPLGIVIEPTAGALFPFASTYVAGTGQRESVLFPRQINHSILYELVLERFCTWTKAMIESSFAAWVWFKDTDIDSEPVDEKEGSWVASKS